jgi:long-chain acyl-CoA synthetase
VSHNLASILTETAEQHGDRIALRLDDTEVSYEQVEEGSARVAAMLKAKGLEVGDRVAVMLPNVPYFALVYYGALRAGGVVVPINPQFESGEVAYHLGDSEAKVLFVWHDFTDAAEKGTEDIDCEIVSVAPEEFEQTIAEDDVVLGALPLFHVFGQACGLNASVKLGACLSMIAKFNDEKTLEVIQRDGVTIFQGVPTMYSAVLGLEDLDSYDTSSIRVAISGGQAMPVEVMQRFEDTFGVEVLEGYGLSETTAIGTFNQQGSRKHGSIGKPVEGVEVKFFDDDGNEVDDGDIGEIAIKGPNVMTEYWNKPEETEEDLRDGWFFTGDLGHIDEDGFVFVDDRKKDMIIRGGENVYPREIEEVLHHHDDVEEVAVIGVEDERLGEEVAAAIVLVEGAESSAEDLQEYVKGELARYKYPRKVFFLDELPKGPTGKILKREIEVPEDA